ncbi:DUF1801 domain-containing protein [Tepidiforma sp.]|uniref:DUF1801 domain-containing protein n=1 Tax=Tepidiforma sp. TaxID=2682230 RepID=UPI002ADD3F24|nr:DUF1801 domain-containing protein [Tepidiforma sp.]
MSNETPAGNGPGEIDRYLADLGDWRGDTLARLRALIREADPGVVETWKWVRPSSPGTPTWEHDGIICTGGAFRGYVKLTFARGAELPDPAGLFNAGFGGNLRRAIDLREGEFPDPDAFRELVRAAVARNQALRAARAKPKSAAGGSR